MNRFPNEDFSFPINMEYIFFQQQSNTREIMQTIRSEHNDVYSDLERLGLNRNLIDLLITFIVNFTISQEGTNLQPRQVYNRFRNQIPWFNLVLRQINIRDSELERIIIRIIEIVLDIIRNGSRPPEPGRGWSRWESLGGVLTTAPAAASWQPNRLDVFAGGTGNSLYHIWWDGSRWSSWESLGGTITSAPAAVSWGPNRIDVFARGTDNALWHIWWDGNRWSEWESLGGSLTSGPAAVSWGPNRIDVFARGTDNALWHIWWDGNWWSSWESLGGVLTSGPAVSSKRPNHLDVFVKGTNNTLYKRTWNGSRWEEWENLGVNIDSDPAAVSWGPNRTDLFSTGPRRDLLHMYEGR